MNIPAPAGGAARPFASAFGGGQRKFASVFAAELPPAPVDGAAAEEEPSDDEGVDDENWFDDDQAPMSTQEQDRVAAIKAAAGEASTFACDGCDTFGCLQGLKIAHALQWTDGDCLKFLMTHNLCAIECLDCKTKPKSIPTTDTWRCWKCRQRIAVLNPWITPRTGRSPVSPRDFFIMAFLLANNVSLKMMKSLDAATERSIRNTTKVLLRPLATFRLANPEKFLRCSVDETFFGARKYNRGKPVRKEQMWFLTATSKHQDGQTPITFWKPLYPGMKRDAPTCKAFCKSIVVGKRSTIVTDGWKAYKCIGFGPDFIHERASEREAAKDAESMPASQQEPARGRKRPREDDDGPVVKIHSVVLHTKNRKQNEFVNSRGASTNNVEGSHAVIKGFVKKQFHHATTLEHLNCIVQFRCLMYAVGEAAAAAHLFSYLVRVRADPQSFAGDLLAEWRQ